MIGIIEGILAGVETTDPNKVAVLETVVQQNIFPEISSFDSATIGTDFKIPANFFASTQHDNPLKRFLFAENSKIKVYKFNLGSLVKSL